MFRGTADTKTKKKKPQGCFEHPSGVDPMKTNPKGSVALKQSDRANARTLSKDKSPKGQAPRLTLKHVIKELDADIEGTTWPNIEPGTGELDPWATRVVTALEAAKLLCQAGIDAGYVRVAEAIMRRPVGRLS